MGDTDVAKTMVHHRVVLSLLSGTPAFELMNTFVCIIITLLCAKLYDTFVQLGNTGISYLLYLTLFPFLQNTIFIQSVQLSKALMLFIHLKMARQLAFASYPTEL